MYVIAAYERTVSYRPGETRRVLRDENNGIRKFQRFDDALRYKLYLDGLRPDRCSTRYEPEWWTLG